MELKDFSVEYRKNPIGLDTLPRFSWKLCSDKSNTLQSAYRIQVSTEKDVVWDTGKIESGQSVLVEYAGVELLPRTLYSVKVTVWDNYDQESEIEGFFETGLLQQENWKAKWITHTLPVEEPACPIFVSKFSAGNKKIKKARAYVTSCGVYELQVNGQKAGDAFLAPGWTSYYNRLQYQTYDITELLEEENEIAITVGNGWYKGYLNGEGKNCFYGDRTAVLAMVCVEYEDGDEQIIGTDTDWLVTTGLIRSSEIYHGETQDFHMAGRTDYCNAVLFQAEEKITKIVAQESESIRVTKRLPAKEKIVTPKGELVLDFGQNMAGLVEVRLPALTGESLVITYAETLDKHGNFYMENLRTARCRDEYIYGPEQVDCTAMPHFTYHGFRYIRIEGVGKDVDMERFTACALHTDMAESGSFVCDNPLINRLMDNIEWGTRSNFFDIPTDCPQRDERLGWTGDAQIFCRTASHLFQTAPFYRKWLHDVAVETDDEHGVPHIVPNIVGPAVGTAIWSDCATVIPWTVYTVYGDKRILEEQYENMRQWVEYIIRSAGDKALWLNGFQRGDWLSLDSDATLNLMSGGTDKNLVANVYYAYSVRIVRDAAKVLGKDNDFRKYDTIYESIVSELNNEFITPNGRVVTPTQTAYALLLYFDLVNEEHRESVIKAFRDNIIAHKGHLTTGFVGTAFLCHALTENGLHDLAEDIVLTEEYPGWLYEVKKGATTIWERWNSALPNGDFDESGMNSFNHYSLGSVGDWFYRKVAGINLLEPGYRKILISPILMRSITEMKASYETPYGIIKSAWRCKDGILSVDVAIPPNTTAVLMLPEQDTEIELGSGTYHYEYSTDTHLESGRFSMNSAIGEILKEEGAATILLRTFPMMSDPMALAYMRGKALRELEEPARMVGADLKKLIWELNCLDISQTT